MTGLSAAALLRWYDKSARTLPWRAPPGAGKTDPYRVWLSEIMLQQTTVATVGPYFERFTTRWPTVEALAAAPREDVLAAWAGLGYYARARNLHRCAEVVTQEHAGQFPDTVEGLLALPGIGAYTAGAVAAIAFGRPVAAVDGNVERVITRALAITEPLPAAKPAIKAAVEALIPPERPGDFAQAMMDLGATVCTPKSPGCMLCPWREPCAGRATGNAESLPLKAPKKPKPERRSVVFAHFRQDGAILMVTRPDKGLLGGMTGLPGPDWGKTPPGDKEITAAAPCATDWHAAGEEAHHVFTHFTLRLRVMVASGAPVPGAAYTAFETAREGAPTVFRKAMDIARAALPPDAP